MRIFVKNPTAAFLMIGNELLSGRTQDKNLQVLARALSAHGVRLREVRVIPDIEETIIKTTQELAKNYDHVFTSGGIGPTHDDITSASIAKAFSVALHRDPEAIALLSNYYKGELNEARLKMAEVPFGAKLIPNSVSSAPGFNIQNVYVMAGVPSVFAAMIAEIIPNLPRGDEIFSQEVKGFVSESKLAVSLTEIQNRYDDVEIGSYPGMQDGIMSVTLVARGLEKSRVALVCAEMQKIIDRLVAEKSA
jgi:molybdenum cofactor synthesis domain-containing protein